ncbi:MAG: oxidoreductase [Gammaproteobacteria bacterium]|nr:oxidoreductase [Gammaproteobacteria bacterium]
MSAGSDMREFPVFRIRRQDGKVAGRVEDVALDDLSSGEVVIRACWSSVNYKDALAATGANRIIREFPRVGGIDVAGRVELSSAAEFRPGDQVLATGYDMGVAHDGGYAHFVRLPASWVIPLPDGMSMRQAMALGTAGFTVALCVQRLEENGQQPAAGPVAVTGASGGVGSLAVAILSRLGYEVCAISAKPEARDYLVSLGAAEVIDRRSLDLGRRPLEKGRWGGALDNVGGEMLSWLTRSTRPWGNVVAVGLAGGSELQTTVMPFILRGVALLGVSAADCPLRYRRPLWGRLASDLAPTGLDRIAHAETTLEGLPRIFEAMLRGEATGRTLVRLAADAGAGQRGT